MEDKVSVEQINDVEYKISILVSPENVNNKFDTFFNSVKKEAVVPGFRKGKAPISRLKQLYNRQAKPTVAQLLLTEYYSQAVKDNNINPVGTPEISDEYKENNYPGLFNDDKSYSIDMSVEVLPSFKPVGYDNLTLSSPDYDDDLLFETKMNEYRERFAERKQILDRGALEGDALVVDFEGFVNGEKMDGGSAEGFTIDKLGSASLIPGFQEQMVGMMPGQSDRISVVFPEEYNIEHLAGQKADFNITVHSIVETKLAEIDDELALLSGFQDVEDMKKQIKEYVEDYKVRNNRHIMDKQIIDELLKVNDFNVPTAMIHDEKHRLMGEHAHDNLPDNVKQELENAATRNVKRAIIIDKIYDTEDDVEITPETLSDMLEKHAEQSGQTKDELVNNLYTNNQMDAFVAELREQNVIDFIISKAQVETKNA